MHLNSVSAGISRGHQIVGVVLILFFATFNGFLLTGSAGSVYQIQTSTDLTNWFPWRLITNVSGSTSISDAPVTNSVQFYRSRFVP